MNNKNSIPKLVVSVLVRNGDKYLLVKETIETGKEKWLVPGGKVEFGESLEDAARREILEETGIKVNNLDYMCFWEAIFPEVEYHTVIFFYSTEVDETDLSEDIEGKVIKARWLTEKEARKRALVESAEWLFDWMKEHTK